MQKIFSETTVIKKESESLKKSFLESQMIAKTNALIFCAHGSSSQIHYENVKKLVNYIKNKVDADCFFCFIEKSEPNIDKFFDEIRKPNIKNYFFFLFSYSTEIIC